MRDKWHVLAKCAKCVGGAGIAICTVFMTLGAIGIIAIGVSQNSSMAGMTSAASSSPSVLSPFVSFLSGFWGEALLISSFMVMLLGLWLAKSKIAVWPALVGAVILFFGMYVQFSIVSEVVGGSFLIFAYAVSYGKGLKLPKA